MLEVALRRFILAGLLSASTKIRQSKDMPTDGSEPSMANYDIADFRHPELQTRTLI